MKKSNIRRKQVRLATASDGLTRRAEHAHARALARIRAPRPREIVGRRRGRRAGHGTPEQPTLAPTWPARRLGVGPVRHQGITIGPVLGHAYAGASVPVGWVGGVVRLRATHTGFQLWVSADLQWQSRGCHAGTPPSLDRTRSVPSLLTHSGLGMQRHALAQLCGCVAWINCVQGGQERTPVASP